MTILTGRASNLGNTSSQEEESLVIDGRFDIHTRAATWVEFGFEKDGFNSVWLSEKNEIMGGRMEISPPSRGGGRYKVILSPTTRATASSRHQDP